MDRSGQEASAGPETGRLLQGRSRESGKAGKWYKRQGGIDKKEPARKKRKRSRRIENSIKMRKRAAMEQESQMMGGKDRMRREQHTIRTYQGRK